MEELRNEENHEKKEIKTKISRRKSEDDKKRLNISFNDADDATKGKISELLKSLNDGTVSYRFTAGDLVPVALEKLSDADITDLKASKMSTEEKFMNELKKQMGVDEINKEEVFKILLNSGAHKKVKKVQ